MRKTVKLKVEFVLHDWLGQKGSIYQTEKGVELSMGSFHSGSTFQGTITIPADEVESMVRAIREGNRPVFWMTKNFPDLTCLNCGGVLEAIFQNTGFNPPEPSNVEICGYQCTKCGTKENI